MTDLTELNRKAWDARAASYDSEAYMQKVTAQITEALRSRADWIFGSVEESAEREDEVGRLSLLDYACGTGTVTRAFQAHISRALGIDLSASMVDVYNKRMQAELPQGVKASAVVGDLVAEEEVMTPSDQAIVDFDIAAVGLGFHHFENPGLCLKRLAERVKKGTGVVLIVDWLAHGHDDGHKHAHGHGHGHGHHGQERQGHDSAEKPDNWEAMQSTVKHHGFTEESMRKMFEDAGLVDFGMAVLEEPIVLMPQGRTITRTGFLARGRRA